MKELRTQIAIQAPHERVWETLTDFENYPLWNPFIQEIHGKFAIGEKLEVHIVPPQGQKMIFHPILTHIEPGRSYRWLGRLLLPRVFDGEHIYELESDSDANVTLVHRELFAGILVGMLWKSVDTNVRSGFEAMNGALKARCESATQSIG